MVHRRRSLQGIGGSLNDIPGVSVVIPVYNSAPTLRPLLTRLRAVFATLDIVYEIVLVNDGSRDESWLRIVDLGEAFPERRGIDLMRNYGQHNALLCGIRAARYGVIVTMDDDLQHPPEEIPVLLAKLAEGYDLVFGTPSAPQHGHLRNAGSALTRLLLETSLGATGARRGSSFRAFRTPLRDGFADYSSPTLSIDVLLGWSTNHVAWVPVAHQPRDEGRSNYTPLRLFTHAFSMITGSSLLPLQLATMLGFLFTLIGLIVLVVVLLNYVFRGGGVPGFTFLASIIALFAGAQLFVMGIFGEYLARMAFRTMGKPVYRVREDLAATGSEQHD